VSTRIPQPCAPTLPRGARWKGDGTHTNASTARPKVKVLREPGEPGVEAGPFVQVSRMANPLVNELIITTPFKDGWNAAEPES
jgi:hypothetical protein